MQLRVRLVFVLWFCARTLYAQNAFLRPTNQSSLIAIHPGMMIGNYTSNMGFNFQQGSNSGESLVATYGEHNRKIGGSYSLVGVLDNNSYGIQTKSISVSYSYRLMINRNSALQFPVSYTFEHKAYDSLYFGSRYGKYNAPIFTSSSKVRSHGFGTGLLYFNKKKYDHAHSDTKPFFPTYNYYLGFYANNIFVLRRQINLPEESDFTSPLTWAIVGGYNRNIGNLRIYPTASYQYQGASVKLSTTRFIKDTHVFDLNISAVKHHYLFGVGARQITGLEHLIYAQLGYSANKIDVQYSFGLDVLNREDINRHQFTIAYNRKTKTPPRKWKSMGLPDF